MLARGEVGLIIPGYMYVHRYGQAMKRQTGIYSDKLLPGLTKLVSAVHQEGGKVVFQLSHAGRQTSKKIIGRTPLAPSSRERDPIYFSKPKRMTEKEIIRVIKAFGEAGVRAVRAGADGIQIHACHCYLVNEFLSPYFNVRSDAWGGTDEKRFRFLKSIILELKKEMPQGMPLLVKMNVMDFTPESGITVPLAVKYAKWLADLRIEGLEISCGSPVYSFMNMCRGDVPVDELVSGLPLLKKALGLIMLKYMKGKFDLEEAYNLGAAIQIKPVIGKIPLFLVGGVRRVSQMEDILKNGYADFISMSRPFIREPFLVKKLKKGKHHMVSCVSCNRCLAAAANNQTVKCYYKSKG
jgi:2,4-dienoyl-CoA reductase-like NADH-dependent reductase (Old Yellow Enzyme family)